MMNKSRIEYCDFTWNPVTGCTRECPYCYARKQARRFCGDIRFNKMSGQIKHAGDGIYILERPFKKNKKGVILFPAGFAPTFHKYRLPMVAEKKKPANIFVCSMGDLFLPDIPLRWIADIFDACEAAPWHNYLFLTKYPERYQQLDHLALLPKEANFWYGTTITNQDDAIRIQALPPDGNRFLCIEPMLGSIDLNAFTPSEGIPPINWLIVGAETGKQTTKVAPEHEWISQLLDWARNNSVPVHLKDSAELRAAWENTLIQKFPKQLRLQREETIIPHCLECEEHSVEFWHHDKAKGDIYTHFCHDGGGRRAIPGRYMRTSPPWCGKRKGGKTWK